jgi:hypothetical protein
MRAAGRLPRTRPEDTTRLRLSFLSKALAARTPAELDALGSAADVAALVGEADGVTDGWRRPLAFARSEAGGERIVTLRSDRPGVPLAAEVGYTPAGVVRADWSRPPPGRPAPTGSALDAAVLVAMMTGMVYGAGRGVGHLIGRTSPARRRRGAAVLRWATGGTLAGGLVALAGTTPESAPYFHEYGGGLMGLGLLAGVLIGNAVGGTPVRPDRPDPGRRAGGPADAFDGSKEPGAPDTGR